MDPTFDYSVCYISKNTKLRIKSTQRKSTLKITYFSSKTTYETTVELEYGTTLICFCRVNFENEKIKIKLSDNCKLVSLQENDTHTTLQITGHSWFNICMKSSQVYHKVVEYKSHDVKWVPTITTSCQCMMIKELDVICNLLDQTRLFGNLEDDFGTRLKSVLFQTHCKNWYENGFCNRNERTLVHDLKTKEISKVLDNTIKILYPEISDNALKFSRSFIIYYSPHLVEYKFDNDPFVREFVD